MADVLRRRRQIYRTCQIGINFKELQIFKKGFNYSQDGHGGLARENGETWSDYLREKSGYLCPTGYGLVTHALLKNMLSNMRSAARPYLRVRATVYAKINYCKKYFAGFSE